MPIRVLRNSRAMRGATHIEIAGDTATVEVETGSELDGFLYYNATREDSMPSLGLQRAGDERAVPNSRYQVTNEGGNVYTLKSNWDIIK